MPTLRTLNVSWIAILLISSVAAADNSPATDAEPTAANAPAAIDLSGNWSGTWHSHANGHNGPLTGNFTKLDDDHYCVQFRGRFLRLLPFKYQVVLTVTERKGDTMTLSGSSDLGFLFGTFWYEATVSDTSFVASYCSKRDHGVFSMSRCCCCCE